MILDCCHSGSALDLPYVYSIDDKVKFRGLARFLRGEKRVSTNSKGLFREAIVGWRANRLARRTRTSSADVFSWAACMDSEEAAEPTGAGRGAMSHAFIEVLSRHNQHTYQSLLVAIRQQMRSQQYTQKPLLSSSHPMVSRVNVVSATFQITNIL